MKNGQSKYVKTSFRKCTLKDFEDVGLIIDSSMIETYTDRLCP